MNFKAIALGAVCAFCCLATGVAAEPEPKQIKPCVAITGADTRVTQRGCHRITSPDEWAGVWQEHKGAKRARQYDTFYDELTLPFVDFEKYMVIAVFQGTFWNSAGLKAVSISEEAERIVFRFEDKFYQTEDGSDKVNAYGFFVLPRSTKAVVLEENLRHLKDDPALWKERKVFHKLQE